MANVLWSRLMDLLSKHATSTGITLILLLTLNKLLRNRKSVQDSNLVTKHERGKTDAGKSPQPGRLVEVSGVETGIINYSRSMNGAYKVGLVVKVAGPKVSDERLQMGLKMLQNRHPLLRMVLLESNGKLFLEEKDGLRLDYSREDLTPTNNAETVWEKTHARARAQLGTQLLTIVILDAKRESGEHATEFLFVMDHAWCDGLSITNLCSELLQFIAEDNPNPVLKDPLPFQSPLEVLAVERYGGGVLSYLRRIKDMVTFLIPIIRTGEASKFPFGKSLVTPMPAKDMGDCVVRTYTKVLPVKGLLKACKAKGVTVGVAVAAASCTSVARAVKHAAHLSEKRRPVAISLAADMRRRFTPILDEHHLGFYVSALHSYFAEVQDASSDSLETADDLWARAAMMSDRFKEKATELASYQLSQLIEFGLAREPTHEGLATMALTNWGRIKVQPSYGDWRVEDVCGQFNPVNLLMPTMLISSFNGSLRLHLCVTEPAACGKAAVQVMDDIERALVVMSQG